MAKLKDIQRKIAAVKKTMQITRAMNMVAAAKLRKVQAQAENFVPYSKKFTEVLGNIAARIEPDIHPLLIKREEIKRCQLLLFTADRGLCGNFNTNLINRAEKWIKEQEDKGIRCDLIIVGKKGRDYFEKRDYNIVERYVNIYGKVDMRFINQLTEKFTNSFITEEVDEVYMMYSRFVSMLRQEPVIVKIIPVEPPKTEAEASVGGEYLCEPSPEELLVQLLPKHINVQIMNAFFQNETSEHAARMTAMDNATKNCSELINDLTLLYNKVRQAAITAELMDIVGGAEALRKV
ncbi:MAG: ATP synthase F1 subunit gamma [Deltaproteobacteria bacterium]|nr:MAG: ATP synthase F1 subunit gamma [Deltaproteobacteria bacterium]